MIAAMPQLLCSGCGATSVTPEATCPACGARVVALRAPQDAMIGKVLDERFEVRSVLGTGGMGAVYRAYQRSTDREVAIKVIDPRRVRDVGAVRRFLREAKLASQLSHPNTVSVFDFGQSADGYLYLVMELVKGRTLSAVVREEGALGLERAVRIAIQLCDALEVAHAMSIVHRDLKPANVMVLDHPPGRDLVKVLDFGIAKTPENDITEDGLLVGTPRYMSPQVLAGADAGPDSDLYALGVMLIELTTGTSPYASRGLQELVQKKLVSPVLPPGVPGPLRPIIENLLDPSQELRIQTAVELRRRLASIASARSVDDEPDLEAGRRVATSITELASSLERSPAVEPSPVVEPLPAGSARRRWWLAGAIAATLFGVTAGVVTRRDRRDAGEPEPARERAAAPGPRAIPDSHDATAALVAPPQTTNEPASPSSAPAAAAAAPSSPPMKPPARTHKVAGAHPRAPVRKDAANDPAPARKDPAEPPAPAPPVERCKQQPRPADCAPF